MRKTFIINLALLLFLNLLVKPFWIFGIDVSVQNAVGEHAYGFYFSLLSFSVMLNILLDLGIENYNKRNIAQNHQLLSKHVSNVIALKLILSVAYFAISVLFAIIIGWEFDKLKLLFVLLINQALSSFVLYFRSNISGLQLFRTDSLISVVDRLLMIVFCSFLLWGNITDSKFQIEWFVYAQTAAYFITALIAFFVVYSKCEFIKLRFDRSFFIVFLKQSYPYALLILIMACFNRIDPVFLDRLLPDSIGSHQAGIYAQGFRFLEAATMFGYLFGGLLIPMFSKMIKQNEPLGQLVQLSFLLLAVPAIIISIFSGLYRNEVFELFYPNHDPVSPLIFAILMVGFIFISTGTYIFGSLLTANGSMKPLNIIAGSALIINIILNLILVPKHMALGSAISSLTTQIFFAVSQLILVIRTFKFQTNFKLIGLLVLFTSGVGGLGMICKEYINNWIVGLFLVVTLSFFLAIVIRLINLKALYQIVKSKDEN